MKIKNYLITSYIIVMLIPILTGALIYKWIQSYNGKTEFNEYMNVIQEISKYETKLQDPGIYLYKNKNLNILEVSDINAVQINLYDKYGVNIYSTQPSSTLHTLSYDQLFKDLYQLKSGYRADSIKKPVFSNGELTGFYQIDVIRSRLIKGANNISAISAAIFAAIFIFVLSGTIFVLNRRMTRPIGMLMKAMTRYAQNGENFFVEYKRNDEIGQLIKHFEWMQNEIEKNREIIERQQKERKYMIAAVSHDLKTPLTSIRAYAESLGTDVVISKKHIQEYTSVIIGKCDYMKNMIDDLLMYTVLNSEYKLELVCVDGQEFFEMLLSGYNELCESIGASLQVQVNVSGSYKVDVKQMMRVADNLVNNASRYAGNGGSIFIGAVSKKMSLPLWLGEKFIEEIEKWREDSTMLIVMNSGSVIADENKDIVFEPFYQADSSRHKGANNGAGLGLSIVKLIIEKHNGRVKVLSDSVNGTAIVCAIEESIQER